MTINTNYGKITADQDTLNFILVLARDAAQENSKEGYVALAKEARDFARHIYNEMEKAGMYKDF